MRLAAAAGLAALALASAGCGDAAEEFRDDLRPLESRAEEQRAAIAVELRTVTPGSRSDARQLREHTARLADAYAELAELDPPDEYREPFGDYVRANGAIVRDLERIAAAIVTGSDEGLRRAGRRVVRDLGVSQSARLRLLE